VAELIVKISKKYLINPLSLSQEKKQNNENNNYYGSS